MPIYKDNAQNRKLKRVGMGYGTECSPCKVKKKEEPEKKEKPEKKEEPEKLNLKSTQIQINKNKYKNPEEFFKEYRDKGFDVPEDNDGGTWFNKNFKDPKKKFIIIEKRKRKNIWVGFSSDKKMIPDGNFGSFIDLKKRR